MVIINPGSRIATKPGDGWTNTHEQAAINIRWFLDRIREEGITDIEMTDTGREYEGSWLFEFQHKVTGVVVAAEQHGIDNLEAYRRQHLFDPRIYWNGSSTATPKLEDFAADGFEPVQTYRPVAKS